MAGNLITSLLSRATNLHPSITASAQAPPSSSSNYNSSQKRRARAAQESLERLMRTLKWIEATMYDAYKREIIDRSVKLWLKDLKKVAYDAEDVLCECQYEVTRAQVEAIKTSQASGSHKRASSSLQVEARKTSQASGSHKRKQMEDIECTVQIPDSMLNRLEKTISRFDEIVKDREALQLRESDGVRRPNNKKLRLPMDHMVDEASIFGRHAEIEEVIDFLLSEKEKPFSVISIIGKGGLGKTTIAQLVYKDGRVSRFFDLFGWVCVSEEFDVGRLTKEIIESVSKINYSLSELSSLQEKLAEIVKGKTILLVLDDVWNENKNLWELVQVPFKEAKMVRILVTTRNKKVADVMETSTLFRPINLPESSCWQLFQHYALTGTSNTVPAHLVHVGREIMRKCGGLPLAVKSIGSLLRHETEVESWREIVESYFWESNSLSDIFPALQISYAHLPPHLKPCFLLCSMYPKDYLLEKKHLIDLWISHGYIEPKGKRGITKIGVEYYEELKERSFLEDFSDESSKYCKLNNMIHDLAQLISENEHYSMDINQPLNTQNRNVLREVFHLYARGLMGYVNQILEQNLKGLRTLSLDLVGHSEELEDSFTKCEALRVLELKGCVSEIPYSIFKLKRLTYLGITSFDLKTLPLSIGLLYDLRTLILDCYHLEYLPESIGDLANLQFLNIESRKFKKLPKSLCLLNNLLRLVIKCNLLEEVPLDIRNLHNLQELTISSILDLALPNTIGCLSSLEELNLSSLGDTVKDLLGYVPHDLISFPAIKKMAAGLRVRNIAWLKDMKSLEGRLTIEGLEKSNLVDSKHANLRNKCKLEALDLCWKHDPDCDFLLVRKRDLRLRLRLEACEDGLVGANDVDFSLLECLQPHPNLKKLRVRDYPSATVPEWMRDPFCLQSIQEVQLEFCHYIQSVPFRNLHTLKHLTIYACHSIRVLQLEQLSSQLEELEISDCGCLELITGLGDLDKLATLKICGCRALKSLAMDGLQLVETTEPFDDSSHENPHISRRRISSLEWLEIEDCKLLHPLPDEVIPYGPSCYVRVHGCGCPNVEIGHLQ